MRLGERLVGAAQGFAGGAAIVACALGIDQCGMPPAQINGSGELLLALGGLLGVLERVLRLLAGIDKLVAHRNHQPAIDHGQGAVALAGFVGVVGDVIGDGARLHGSLRDQLNSLFQSLGHVIRAMHDHPGAERGGAVTMVQCADDALRVVDVVAVHPHRLTGWGLILAGFHPGGVGRNSHQPLRALAQNHDVGDDLGAGVFLERTRRQADGCNQFGLLRQLSANAGVLLVH